MDWQGIQERGEVQGEIQTTFPVKISALERIMWTRKRYKIRKRMLALLEKKFVTIP